MLVELGPCEAAHVSSCACVGDAGRAADNVSPQGQGALPLYELQDRQRALHWVDCIVGTGTWSRPTGVFPRARSREGGLEATVA